MKKTKQILALIGALLLFAMYGVTLIFALIGSDLALTLLKAAVVCTIIVPVFLYAYILVYRVVKPEDSSSIDDMHSCDDTPNVSDSSDGHPS